MAENAFNSPEEMEDFIWEKLSAGCLTDGGSALKELNSKLSQHEYLKSMMGALMPVIIFMTDGWATDKTSNYEDALEEIRKNRWFKRGTKIGFALGDDADIAMIASVVGNKEAVIQTTDLDLFTRLMKFVSVTASMLVSQSATAETASSGADIVQRAMADMDLPDNVIPDLDDSQYNKEPVSVASDDGWSDDDDEW